MIRGRYHCMIQYSFLRKLSINFLQHFRDIFSSKMHKSRLHFHGLQGGRSGKKYVNFLLYYLERSYKDKLQTVCNQSVLRDGNSANLCICVRIVSVNIHTNRLSLVKG